MDLTRAAKEAQARLQAATRDILPMGSIPNIVDLNLKQRAQKMTGRHVLALADQIGDDLAAKFVRKYIREE